MSKSEIIPIVELEQFKLLPISTQKLINDLSANMKSSSLTVFNPLVEAMTQIEAFRTIKFVEDDEECIKSFKTAKSTIRSFNAATGKAKTKLKAPYLKIGKDIDLIEKTFKESAAEVLQALLNDFKPYLDEEKKKKEDREAKKNKATTDKINELSDEAVQNTLIIQRMNVKSDLDKRVFGITKVITEKVANYSSDALKQELAVLSSMSLDLTEQEKAVLLPEQVEELQENFNIAIENSKTMINMKIVEMANAVNYSAIPPTNNIEVIAEEIKPEIKSEEIDVFALVGDNFMAPTLNPEDDDYFRDSLIDIITETIEKITELETKTEDEANVKIKVVTSFSAIQDKVTSFLS